MKINELLSKAERWTQHAMARDHHGLKTDPKDPKAVCWCLMGAVIKCYESEKGEIVKKLQEQIYSLFAFNDNSSHEMVLKLVKRLDI